MRDYLQTRKSESPWLFPGQGGGPTNPDAFRPHTWKKLLQRAGVPYQPPHALRHPFASELLEAGESPAYVREQLGHSSIKIAVDIYGHLVPGFNKQAVNRLPWNADGNHSGNRGGETVRSVKGRRT